jgi:hypothetical protein
MVLMIREFDEQMGEAKQRQGCGSLKKAGTATSSESRRADRIGHQATTFAFLAIHSRQLRQAA